MTGAKRIRHLLRVNDLTTEDILRVYDVAEAIRVEPDRFRDRMARETVGLLFEKASTRTRLSFEAGIHQMGGDTVFMGGDSQLVRGETIEDTAKIMGGYLDMVVVRTFGHDRLERFAKASAIPVLNGLTDAHHPCQALSDYSYIRRIFGALHGIRVAYVGDGNNMAHSLIEGAASLGVDLILATPEEYRPDPGIVKDAEGRARVSGGSVAWTKDPMAAAKGAHVLYTDVWTSMGQESESAVREQAFRGYQINRDLLDVADRGAIVLHCLPAYRGKEIAADVLDGPRSHVFSQAENRLYVQKSLMLFCQGKE